MGFLSGKFALMAYEGGTLQHLHPAARTFRLLAAQLADATEVVRLDSDASITVVEVRRETRPPLTVFWRNGDVFAGEDEPGIAVEWPWQDGRPLAIDAFDASLPCECKHGALRLAVSVTPVFVTPEAGPTRLSRSLPPGVRARSRLPGG